MDSFSIGMVASSFLGGKNHQVPEWRKVGSNRARGRGVGPAAASWIGNPDSWLVGEQMRGEGR